MQEEEAVSSSDRMKADVLHWRWAPSTPEELTAAIGGGIVSDHQADLGHFRLSGWGTGAGSSFVCDFESFFLPYVFCEQSGADTHCTPLAKNQNLQV